MEEINVCVHCRRPLLPREACDCDGARAEASAREAEVRILVEKLPGQENYRRTFEASSVNAAYNGVALLIRDIAGMTRQPLDHVVAVLATIVLAPAINEEREG